jgi:arabinoxylan arabinofuranohydrolase
MTNDTQGYAPDPVTGVSPGINYGNINQLTLISSTDLVNWVDHGEIQVAGPNGVAPFTNNSWAPGMAKQVVAGEEKSFLYYANGGGSSNVITGESPLGSWTSERTSMLINGSTPGAEDLAWKFDPAPLVDDDVAQGGVRRRDVSEPVRVLRGGYGRQQPPVGVRLRG